MAGRGLGFAVVSAVAFGGSGPFAKALIGAGFSPQQAAWARIVGAAVLLVPVLLMLRGRAGLSLVRRTWPLLALYGVTGIAACQTLYFVAASRLPVGVAVLLEFTGPVLVIGWLKVVRRTTVPKAAVTGVGIALLGLAIVVEVWSGLRLDLVGLLAGLGAATCNAAYFLVVDRMTGSVDPLVMTSAGLVLGGLALTVVAVPWSAPWSVLGQGVEMGDRTPPGWALLAWIVVVSTVLAYLTGAAAVQRLSAPIGGAVAYLEVVAATGFAWLLLNEQLTLVQVVGGSIVVAGAFVAQSAVRKVKAVEAPRSELEQLTKQGAGALPGP